MDRYSITASAAASSDGRNLGGLEIDRKIEPGRLLDGNIRRLKQGRAKERRDFLDRTTKPSPATLPLFRRAGVIYSNAWGEEAATGSP
jgi:hypothetical protein